MTVFPPIFQRCGKPLEAVGLNEGEKGEFVFPPVDIIINNINERNKQNEDDQ